MELQKTLLNEKQAARLLGVGAKALQAWRCRGVGPTFLKIGRLVKYSQADLDTFLEGCRRESTSGGAGK